MVKKGQSALEFLTTYGFAFIVVLGGLVVLTAMVSPDDYVANTCFISESFGCEDYALKAGVVVLKTKNVIGKQVTIDSIECEYKGQVVTDTGLGVNIPAGDTGNIKCSALNTIPDDKKSKVTFTIGFKEAGKEFTRYSDGYIVLQNVP